MDPNTPTPNMPPTTPPTPAGPPPFGPASLPPQNGQQPLQGASVKPAWQVEAMQKAWQKQGVAVSAAPLPPNSSYVPLPPSAPQSNPYAPPAQTATPPPPNFYPAQQASAKRGSGKLVTTIVVLLIIIAGGVAALFYLLQPAPPDGAQVLSAATSQSLKVPTYKEHVTIQKGGTTTTRNREADFRKIEEARLHADNIADPVTSEQIETTVVGKDYYVKRKVTETELASVVNEQDRLLLAAANDQWVLAIDDGNAVQSPTISALGVLDDLAALRVVVPSPMLMGYFSNENQQALSALIGEAKPYTVASEPSGESLDGQPVWRMKVAVNSQGVKTANSQAARLLGYADPEKVVTTLEGTIPPSMELWVRQGDNFVTQLRYTLNDTTYTHVFESIGQELDVQIPSVAPLAALTATDVDMQAAADKVFTLLKTYQTQGNALPGTANSFQELVKQRLSQDVSANYDVRFENGTPTKARIFYQPGHVCTDPAGGFKKVNAQSSFAVVIGLSNSQYCVSEGN